MCDSKQLNEIKTSLAEQPLYPEIFTNADKFLNQKAPDPSVMDLKLSGLKKHEVHRLMINKAKRMFQFLENKLLTDLLTCSFDTKVAMFMNLLPVLKA